MNKLTRKEVLRRWKSAKVTKKAIADKMQKMLYEDCKLRTGEELVRFNVLLQLLWVFVYALGWVLCFIFASEMKHFYVVEHLKQIYLYFVE